MRDATLVPRQRSVSLAHALEWYAPLRFNLTRMFLAQRVGDVRTDPAAMCAATDLLESSRRLHTAERAAYTARRRVEKAAGYRTPRYDATTPDRPRRWYGPEQRDAARFAFGMLQAEYEVDGWVVAGWRSEARDLIAAAVDAGSGTDRSRDALAAAAGLLRPHRTHAGYERDRRAYYEAHLLDRLYQHAQVLLGLDR